MPGRVAQSGRSRRRQSRFVAGMPKKAQQFRGAAIGRTKNVRSRLRPHSCCKPLLMCACGRARPACVIQPEEEIAGAA